MRQDWSNPSTPTVVTQETRVMQYFLYVQAIDTWVPYWTFNLAVKPSCRCIVACRYSTDPDVTGEILWREHDCDAFQGALDIWCLSDCWSPWREVEDRAWQDGSMGYNNLSIQRLTESDIPPPWTATKDMKGYIENIWYSSEHCMLTEAG